MKHNWFFNNSFQTEIAFAQIRTSFNHTKWFHRYEKQIVTSRQNQSHQNSPLTGDVYSHLTTRRYTDGDIEISLKIVAISKLWSHNLGLSVHPINCVFDELGVSFARGKSIMLLHHRVQSTVIFFSPKLTIVGLLENEVCWNSRMWIFKWVRLWSNTYLLFQYLRGVFIFEVKESKLRWWE